MLINHLSLLKRSTQVETAEMGEEIGMINVETGKYFMLNGIGADIWEVLEEEKTLSQVVDALLEIYEIDREICFTETSTFIQELVENQLILVVS